MNFYQYYTTIKAYKDVKIENSKISDDGKVQEYFLSCVIPI